MRLSALAFLGLACSAAAFPSIIKRQDTPSVNDFIDKHRERSFVGVKANFGGGSEAPDVTPGIVIASPSTRAPDYFYTWTRDAALTLKMIVDETTTGSTELEDYIKNYVTAQAKLQTVSNPSGALYTGRGLGEPKFYGNITRFNDNWGRPQRDGPALRAITLITYSNYLIGKGEQAHVKDVIWPVIYNDLQYTGQYWNSTGFDLWEEVKGASFFTTAAQYRALATGGALAKQIGETCAACESEAPGAFCRLQKYWNGQYFNANEEYNLGTDDAGNPKTRGNIDANTVIATNNFFDPKSKCTDSTFQPCSPRGLQNVKAYVDAFRGTAVYPINGKYKSGAVATGRYIEDIYFTGNPWYLTTLAVAEQLYYAVQQWRSIGSIVICDQTLPFWQDIIPDVQAGTYPAGSPTYAGAGIYDFNLLVNAVIKYADEFVSIAYENVPADGSMAEQFSKINGTSLSARDLTWSYASFITASSARRAALELDPDERTKIQVPSWNETAFNTPPTGACVGTSVKGTYIPAVAAGAPADGAPCTVTTKFNLEAPTYNKENMYVWGNISELGEYRDPFPGSADNYSGPPEGLWTFEFDLPADLSFEYSFLRSEQNGTWNFDPAVYEGKTASCGDDAAPAISAKWAGPDRVPYQEGVVTPDPLPKPVKPTA